MRWTPFVTEEAYPTVQGTCIAAAILADEPYDRDTDAKILALRAEVYDQIAYVEKALDSKTRHHETVDTESEEGAIEQALRETLRDDLQKTREAHVILMQTQYGLGGE